MHEEQPANLIPTENIDEATHVFIADKKFNIKTTVGKFYKLYRWEANASSCGIAEAYIIDDEGKDSTGFMYYCKAKFYIQK
ncbi:hypothetical protein HFE03_07880 [Paenibacillus sp. EKM102P]|uniref:hypothetical protein n=1 Tax=unclassified Paenibacillus TaxID=185978 RepID=UPI00142E2990|nr:MULTISPECIES: hypothetical protein [unclassified Paenibacillus]KAF6620563.1 hypothetical protein HFE00_05785 [Paenibacillus sp. EKM101P]KAF6623555.1 hypothetical protein HFE03_07880 [Paenibacillus sp. EKM102P]KAF6633883.1 hypothetical protein HFE01_06630 [Paenibacillus sp. EKM10P]KAF6649409.1 hypothetical protein HFE02_01590 [Paenibacillus sp. EKM11P]